MYAGVRTLEKTEDLAMASNNEATNRRVKRWMRPNYQERRLGVPAGNQPEHGKLIQDWIQGQSKRLVVVADPKEGQKVTKTITEEESAELTATREQATDPDKPAG
jgi:hypothetical protein